MEDNRNGTKKIAERTARLRCRPAAHTPSSRDTTVWKTQLVTVNSTVGTLALACGLPVIALGKAIYDIPGLTFRGGLDRFWTAPTPPDTALFDAFRRVLANRCLIPGSFFNEAGLKLAVDAAIDRL